MPGTSAGQQAAFLPSHAIQVSERPVTGQGIAGMKAQGGVGPGRQVQDSSFYVGLLRTKLTAITKEIRGLKGEMENMTKDAGQFTQLERKYDEMLSNVRNLEGNLADYNLASDKLRTSTDPQEVIGYQKQLEERNRHEASEIDKVFLLKSQREKQTLDIERQIEEVQRNAEKKIKQLEPEKLKAYEDLVHQSQSLQTEGQTRSVELENLRQKVIDLENVIRGSGMREEYNASERRVQQLQKSVNGFQEDLEIAMMDPKEAHARLLAKVKEDNRKTSELESRLKEIDEEISKSKRLSVELQSDLNEREKGSSSGKNFSQKYELLFQRDAEMTGFLDKFSTAKEECLADQERTKATITALLEHISAGIGAKDSMPSTERLSEMKDEVSFKTKQLETSQQTMQRLQEQRVKRVQELEKINTLDEKIGVELKQLQEKMGTMKDEIKGFDDVEGLRNRATFTKDELEKLREKYIIRRSLIKQQVAALSAQVESTKKAMTKNETGKGLASLESKLRHYEQNIFNLKEFVEQKGRETDFLTLKEGVMDMTSKLNSMAIETS